MTGGGGGLVAAAPFSTYNYQTEALYEL